MCTFYCGMLYYEMFLIVLSYISVRVYTCVAVFLLVIFKHICYSEPLENIDLPLELAACCL